LLFQKELDYCNFRTFGYLTYASTLPSSRDKFSPRAVAAVFLGYLRGYKGYKLLDLNQKSLYLQGHSIL
jgi:hypothetical protein